MVSKSFERYGVLTEEDFYPPADDRVLTSLVSDLYGGDNFADYANYIYKIYEKEYGYEN